MRAGVPQIKALRALTRDGWIPFGTRFLRLFGYTVRFIPVGLVDEQVGSPTQMGVFEVKQNFQNHLSRSSLRRD